jgi:hypothetical protein
MQRETRAEVTPPLIFGEALRIQEPLSSNRLTEEIRLNVEAERKYLFWRRGALVKLITHNAQDCFLF